MIPKLLLKIQIISKIHKKILRSRNQKKQKKIKLVIVFDDMTVHMINNKKLS